jgi:hypothetical protein
MSDKAHFIKAAIKRPGALTARAEGNGESVAGEAAKDEHAKGLKGQQARFYNHVLKKVKH